MYYHFLHLALPNHYNMNTLRSRLLHFCLRYTQEPFIELLTESYEEAIKKTFIQSKIQMLHFSFYLKNCPITFINLGIFQFQQCKEKCKRTTFSLLRFLKSPRIILLLFWKNFLKRHFLQSSLLSRFFLAARKEGHVLSFSFLEEIFKAIQLKSQKN